MAATISIVESSQPSRLLDAASAMDASAVSLNTQIEEQRRQLEALRAHWQGDAAAAAIAKGDADLAVQQGVFAKLKNYAAALRYGGTNLDGLRSQILAMASQARALGGQVNDDGTVIGNLRFGLMTPTLAGAYTASLKAMLSMFTAVDATTAQALQTGGPVPASPVPNYQWTDEDLYNGDPAGADVNQDPIGDCYLVATMSAIANANPQWIKDRIKFNPQTGQFDVTLWDGSQWRHVMVTQSDIDSNIAQQGASGVDNFGQGAPLWPAVLESAYQKMKAPGKDLTAIESGLTPPALEALTGNNGRWIFPATEFFTPSQHIDSQIAGALQNHQPVMLSTSVMGGPLADQHVYSIEAITGTGSDAMVTLRNPWGADNGDATIQLPLGDIIGGGVPGLGPAAMINIGQMGG